MSPTARLTVCWLASALAVSTASQAAPAASDRVPGRVTHVTLYRGQAMVTRTIPIEGAKGSKELVVGDLPEQVVADSLFAEGGEGIEVRAVQFRSRAVGEEPRNEVRKVDEGIEQVNDKLLEHQGAGTVDQADRLPRPARRLCRGVGQERLAASRQRIA
jgi:uncharacterized protein DUF4140